jgi:transketolase
MATGSEVSLALDAKLLEAETLPAGGELRLAAFQRQPDEYRDRVLPPSLTCRVAVERGLPGMGTISGPGWGFRGNERIRTSAPIEDLMKRTASR